MKSAADLFRCVFASSGLFALKPIKPTEYIEVLGELLSVPFRDAREREYLQRGHFALFHEFKVNDGLHEFWIDQTEVFESASAERDLETCIKATSCLTRPRVCCAALLAVRSTATSAAS